MDPESYDGKYVEAIYQEMNFMYRVRGVFKFNIGDSSFENAIIYATGNGEFFKMPNSFFAKVSEGKRVNMDSKLISMIELEVEKPPIP